MKTEGKEMLKIINNFDEEMKDTDINSSKKKEILKKLLDEGKKKKTLNEL